MRCSEVDRLLLEYLEHRLDAKTEARIREHLAACPVCRLEAEQLQKTLALVAGDPVPALKQGGELFLHDIKRRIRRNAERRTEFGVRRWIPAFAVAATLLIAAAVVWQVQRTRPATAGIELLDALRTSDDDTLDIMSVGTVATSDSIGERTAAALESELVDNTDVDDLIDDLSPAQQVSLVQELEQLYGRKQG